MLRSVFVRQLLPTLRSVFFRLPTLRSVFFPFADVTVGLLASRADVTVGPRVLLSTNVERNVQSLGWS